MKYKGFIIFVIVFAITLALSVGLIVAKRSHVPSAGSHSGQQMLEPFESINIDVKSANIVIVEGDDYEIAYSLHEKENIHRLEVVDGTLYLDTGIDVSWQPAFEPWTVTVTIPKDAPLHTLRLRTTAGEIMLADRTIREGQLETTAGAITLRNINSQRLSAKTVSEDIHCTGSIQEKLELETVSGDIAAGVPVNAIHAESVGKIMLNGKNQGYKLHLEGDGAALWAKSVSGNIEIVQ